MQYSMTLCKKKGEKKCIAKYQNFFSNLGFLVSSAEEVTVVKTQCGYNHPNYGLNFPK